MDESGIGRLCSAAAAHSRDAAMRLADCGEELLAVIEAAKNARRCGDNVGVIAAVDGPLSAALDALDAKARKVCR